VTRSFDLPQGIEIRAIALGDIPGFQQCLDSVAREREYLAQVEGPPLGVVEEFVHAAMDRGDIRIVATDSVEVVGWCDITAHRWPGLGHVGELGMGVLKEYRGKGVGISLLNEALNQARQAGLEKVELEVFGSNHVAIKLYERAGFGVDGCKSKGRKLDGEYDDIIMMSLFL
jgi:RimJ/RimL family protein N-acetyltransferase